MNGKEGSKKKLIGTVRPMTLPPSQPTPSIAEELTAVTRTLNESLLVNLLEGC